MPGNFVHHLLGHVARLFSVLCIASAIILSNAAIASSSTSDPFAAVRGKWRGSGTMELRNKPVVRINCDAQYTGSGSQLILAIRCKSTSGDIDLHARLSSNANLLRGVWEEKQFRAIGTISGRITDTKISFRIAGNVWGRMNVAYTKTRQSVTITTTGMSLESVKINMRRRR